MIRLQNVTKTVRSGTEDLTILDDVSMEIPEGQFVALTGASGSGKSTLLGLIAGLDSPSGGRITIDEDDITAMGEDGLADIRSKKIGFIFQSFHLIPSLTAFENILIPMEIRGLRDAKDRANESSFPPNANDRRRSTVSNNGPLAPVVELEPTSS